MTRPRDHDGHVATDERPAELELSDTQDTADVDTDGSGVSDEQAGTADPADAADVGTEGSGVPDEQAGTADPAGSTAGATLSLVHRLVGAPRGAAAALVAVVRAHRRISVGVLAVLLIAGVAAGVVGRLTGLPAGAAFRAGGQVTTEQELAHRVDLLGALYGIKPPADVAGQDTFRRDSAKAIAVSVVLDQEAAARGIVVSEKAARDVLATIVEKQTGASDQASFVKLLADSGASEADVLAEIERQQRTSQLFQQVAGPAAAAVSDADIRAYFDGHPAEMVAPEQRHLRNVVLASQAEAADVLSRARGGASLAAIAAQTTIDPSTRANQGDLGFVTRSQLEDGFGAAAFGAAPGAMFGPVQSAHGWNVGQVLEVRQATPMPFDQIKQSLGDRLRGERGLGAWRDWMAAAVGRADVTYAGAYQPADPAAITSDPAQPGGAIPAVAAQPTHGDGGVASTVMRIGSYVLALVLFGIGLWGRRNAATLAPASLSPDRRERKQRSLRRGGLTCMVGAGFLVLATTAGILVQLL
jgi:peptidyl-prolyl cis-trans isomerase C